MASDSSDDEQYNTADDSESDDQGHQSFHNELSSSSESSDEVSGQASMRGVFKFGKLSSSKAVGKENVEFLVEKDKEEMASEGDEDVNQQTSELTSDLSGETGLHSSVKDWFPGRDSPDSSEDLKKQDVDSIDIGDDSDMKADEKLDTSETMEAAETLMDNMNSCHMSPSLSIGLEGIDNANNTDRTYQTNDSQSISESFVILDPESASTLLINANDQMGEIEKNFQEPTQIPPSEGLEQSFDICDESFNESGPIYENIENIKVTPTIFKDTNMTSLSIPGNSAKEDCMHLSQTKSVEFHKESVKKLPPPIAPKPLIVKQNQGLNGSQIQSIMKDEASNKTDEEQCLKEVEQKLTIRQSLEINESTHKLSQLEMDMIDIVKQEKTESDVEGNCLPMDSFSIIVCEENKTDSVGDAVETADTEQRPLNDIRINDIEQLSQYEKQTGVSVQQPLIETDVNEIEQTPQEHANVDDADQKFLKDTQVDKTQGKLLKDTKMETAKESPPDSKADADQKSQTDIQVGYSGNEEPIKKMPDLVKMFESIVQDQNKPSAELPPVPKRRGNIMLKPIKQSIAEPRPLNQSNAEEFQIKQSNVLKTKQDDCNESRSPKEMGVMLPPLRPKNQVITESVKPENPENDSQEDSAPPTPPPKGIIVMESLKNVISEREMLKNPELTCPPTPPPKSLALVKTHNPDVTSEPSVAQSTPPLLPKRTNQSTSKSTQNIHSGQLHDQQEPDLQVHPDRPYLQTSNLQEDMPGAQSSTRFFIPQGLQGDVQNPATSGGQQNLTYDMNGQPVFNAGTSWQQIRHPLHPGQPWGPQPWGHPHMPMGLHGPHEQYWNPWSFNPSYGHQFPPGMQHNVPGMNVGGFINRPPYVSSQEPQTGQAYKTIEDQNQHLQQQQMQQQQQHQHKQQLQQHQPRLHVPEGETSGHDKHPVPNRKQAEQQNEQKKEIEKAKNVPVKKPPKQKKTSKTSGLPKVSADGGKNTTSEEDKERKAVTSPKRSGQDVVKSSPQPATKNKEQKKEKGTKSEEIDSKPSYSMVIGLSESTSDDNLLNYMEGRSDATVKEVVYGPRRENAVVIFDRKPDQESLQSKVSKKTLDGKVIKVFSMPPPTSIIVSTNDPTEFSKDTLTFHFESKKYGNAELVDDGMKVTKDGCYIMTFTDSDAVERVCAMQHKVENIPLNVSPYYQFKEWMAWNTAIHGINIPKPFSHKVDPVIAKYLVSFPRAMKTVQEAMMVVHAGIELQTDAVLLSCLLNLEVKDCRKLVISWRKDAEENWNKCLSSRFLIEKISNLSNIWKDLIDFVKSLIEGKDILLVEERFEDYIQVIGFYDEVKTTHVEVMKKKEKLERIGRVAKETMPLKSAAKKRLLDRDGIFQRLRVQFSDFDVHFEQSSEEIVLSGVVEDRNNAKLLIFEELRKFDEPFEISDSTDHFNQFIKEGAPKNYIIKEMETNGLIVDWDVSTEKHHVFVYCIPAHSAQHAATQMKKMVKEINIPLSQDAQLFVTTEDWKMYQAETESRCDGLVHIVVTNYLTNIIWTSMEGLYADILQELKDFIKKNTVTEEMIQCNPVIKKYMQTFWEPKDYKEIEEKTGDKHLQLTFQGEKLMVKGTAEGILKAKELWKEKTSKIVHKSHTLKRVGIKEVLESQEQSGMLKALEMEHRCLILTETSNLSLQMKIKRDDDEERIYDTIQDESMIMETSRSDPFKCQNGLTVYLTKGQLAKQKVDVIVCATSPDLNLNSGAASKSLLQEGGQGLQIECKTKYDEKIEEGEVVDINGGNLQCDKVYLTVLPDWRRSNNGQSLMNVMLECLTKADGASKKSIAFAAMGTGQLHYPHEDVASLMYSACVSFDIEHPKSTLKDVRFVLFDKDHVSIKAFEKEEKSMLYGGAIPRSITPPPTEQMFGNIKVLQVIDELAKQKVDAILCSCATNLVLSQSGACAALVKNGGQKLQDECIQKYPNGIQLGEIATIGGGNLKCKHVFLTALPPYTENGESVLSGVMTSALKLAAVHGCKSIAMPAMGTGFLKYPVTIVAKTMYDAVREYAKDNPKTSLTTIKFVLYFKDKPTQSAFKDYMKPNLSRSSTRRNRKIAGHDVRKLQDDKPCIKINPDDSGNLSCSVGKVKVQVYTGDILDEKTDAIVNSVGGDFSFQGGVAVSLKKKCSDLEQRCKDKKYMDQLRKDGVVVMKITGLLCKEIMHVKFQEHLPGWKKIFEKCFKRANKHKLVSLSFPVLGTGGGSTMFDTKKIAETFFEALVQFDEENAGHQLQNINIVVFHKQPQFIPEIKKAMENISLQGPRGTFGKTMDKVKDFGQSFIESFCPRSGVLPPQQKPAASRSQMSIAIIELYSDMERNIKLCISNLDEKLDKAYISMCLTDDLIAKMNAKELEDFFETDLFVECEFIKEEKQVLIRGTQKNVSQAQTLFHKKLINKAREENEKRDAKQLYQVVQWQFEEVTEDGVNLVPYDELTNYKMEEAFKKGDVNLELKDPTKKKTYVVDFKKYVEFDKEDVEDKVKIVRKDILKDKARSLPDFWMEMKSDETIRLVNISNQDPEYTNLETTFMTECKTGSYANRIPNLATMKVLKIQRIQNRTLYQQYAAKKQLMVQHYKDKPNVKVEWKAWHGTAEKNVESIYTHGFNRSYCGAHGVWFGQGVYFATNASYSARAWLSAGNQAPPQGIKQFIFYVSVCVGEYIKGDQKMRYLPAKDPAKPTDVYDSAVNDVNNVEEIVIFNDTQAYPDYLITFTT
ncbi:hypothetical protein ACJMK2_006219 [Sinanodonta woodiana]|uniref:Poly [ADP-ribose] polymerase n=1 Tax=Sinanodonta woodiana TaxID=1069815 RepID=A0ABD3VVM3_SINWO